MRTREELEADEMRDRPVAAIDLEQKCAEWRGVCESPYPHPPDVKVKRTELLALLSERKILMLVMGCVHHYVSARAWHMQLAAHEHPRDEEQVSRAYEDLLMREVELVAIMEKLQEAL